MKEMLNNSCEEYHSKKYTTVAMIAASTGTLSTLASITVILVIILFKKHHFFIQRLILYLCIVAAVNSISIMLRFARVDDNPLDPDRHRLCVATAFIDQTTLWSLTIAFFCLTFNMLMVTVFNRSTKGLEMVYIFAIFLLPITFNWIPFLEDSYGEAGAWCWIRTHDYYDPNCTTHKLGVYLSYALWYVPHYLLLSLVLLAYIVTVINVIRKSYHWRGLYSTELDTEQQKIKELVMPIIFYPLGFLILNLFPLINRIYGTVHAGNPNYVLWILHAALSPLQGGYIALVYVLDKDTFQRLKPRELWAYLFHRKSPVQDYPAARGFTDSYDANSFPTNDSTSYFEGVKVVLNEGKVGRNYGSIDGDSSSLLLRSEEDESEKV